MGRLDKYSSDGGGSTIVGFDATENLLNFIPLDWPKKASAMLPYCVSRCNDVGSIETLVSRLSHWEGTWFYSSDPVARDTVVVRKYFRTFKYGLLGHWF